MLLRSNPSKNDALGNITSSHTDLKNDVNFPQNTPIPGTYHLKTFIEESLLNPVVATYSFKNEGRRKPPLVLRNDPVLNDVPQYTPPDFYDLLKKQVATYSFKDKPRPSPNTLVYKDQVKCYSGFLWESDQESLGKIFYLFRMCLPQEKLKIFRMASFLTDINGLPNLQMCPARFSPVRPPNLKGMHGRQFSLSRDSWQGSLDLGSL